MNQPKRDYQYVRNKLLQREEIALLDVREEAPHAGGHPLFAANLPLSQLEMLAYDRLPRRDVPIATLDAGDGLAEKAAQRLQQLGYLNVAVFDGGIAAWQAAGGELFIDVNVPSKAFGEMVEAACSTPSLPAEEVQKLLDTQADMVIVDVRRFDEYQTMSIPTGISVPGAELVLRIADLAPNPQTQIIVNCAGRTRSLIGAQSLINAGLPNPVAALRNGSIGWTLAKQKLETGQSRRYPATSPENHQLAQQRARRAADKADVKRATQQDLTNWAQQQNRTTYFFDVRTPEEYTSGHIPGFYPAPGGQLVQETEMRAPVRGARIVLVDDDGVRANMTASWLAQMAWDVYVVDNVTAGDFSQTGSWQSQIPEIPQNPIVDVQTLRNWQKTGDVVVVDVAKHAQFKQAHIPDAWYLLRSLMSSSVEKLPLGKYYVLTSDDGALAQFAAPELARLVEGKVYVLDGGNQAWQQQGFTMESGESQLASEPIDRYRRPYEGTDVLPETMQAYLEWEFGLIEQMARDGSHYFKPMVVEG